jgi:hypothetical protein
VAISETTAGDVPRALRGLWTREEIFTPTGNRDATTRVVWLQTRRFYADIRVPADRPARPGATGFEAYADEELIALARMQAFAGVLTAADGICLWRRDLDYQPPDPVPDEARFEIDGDRMDEFGIHADYTEIWRRTPGSGEPLIAWRRAAAPGGLLVVAEDHFLEIQGREIPLPEGASLAAIVEADLAAGRRDLAIARLDMRICYGRVAGAGGPWRVTLSSLPWLEGRGLFDGEEVSVDGATGELMRGGEAWTLEDATILPSDIARLPAPPPAQRTPTAAAG